MQQRVADRIHVDHARQLRRPARQQVRPFERARIDRRPSRRRQQDAARTLAPRPRHRGQTGDRPHRVAAATHALHPVVQAYRRLPGRAECAREIDDHLFLDAANLGRARRRVLCGARLQLIEAERVGVDVCAVDQVFADQYVDHGERERGIGAGFERDMLMTFFSGQRAIRIDRDQPRPATLRFLRARPEMQVRRDRICSPDQDEFAFLEILRVHAEARAVGVPKARRAGRRANRPVEPRRTERIEKSCGDAFALHQPHRAGIAVRNNGFRRAGCDFGFRRSAAKRSASSQLIGSKRPSPLRPTRRNGVSSRSLWCVRSA